MKRDKKQPKNTRLANIAANKIQIDFISTRVDRKNAIIVILFHTRNLAVCHVDWTLILDHDDHPIPTRVNDATSPKVYFQQIDKNMARSILFTGICWLHNSAAATAIAAVLIYVKSEYSLLLHLRQQWWRVEGFIWDPDYFAGIFYVYAQKSGSGMYSKWDSFDFITRKMYP